MIINAFDYNGVCSCGKNHVINTKAAIIEPGCLGRIDKYLSAYGIEGKYCALYGEKSFRATEGCHPMAEQVIIMESEGLHANEISTAKVLSALEDDIEVILAVGSGTIHDIARFCAHERGIRFVSCPTAASVDGFCSTVAAMTWYGYKKTLPAVAPEIVIADIDIIKNAPRELTVSGIGDIMAKYTALADWRISHIVTGEYLCERIFSIMQEALHTAVGCIRGIENGEDCAYEAVTYALIMSGLAMQMMGNSRPASGTEHHFSHTIEMGPEKLKVSFPAMHGEKAGVGTIYALNEYKRLAAVEDITPYLRKYSPLDTDEITDFFGETLGKAILKENEDDCLAAVTPEDISNNWQAVRGVVAELPNGAEVASQLAALGGKSTAASIGVAEEDVPTILHYAPSVRNRLTLMRMKRMIQL